MAAHRALQLDRIPRKQIAARIDESEVDRKILAAEETGRIVARTIDYSGLTQAQFANALGYGLNAAPVSRWIAGIENGSALQRIWSRPALRPALLWAMAHEAKTPGVGVQGVITIGDPRTAGIA